MSWPQRKLSQVAQVNPKRPPINRTDDTLTSFVPMEAVDQLLGEVTQRPTRPFSKLKKGYTYFEEGDVIFAKITPCMQNGKHAIVSELIDGFGFGSTEFHVVRPTALATAEWIHYFLRRKATTSAAIKTFTGTVGQQRVPTSFLEGLDIPVSPPQRQREIAINLKAQLADVEIARRGTEAQLKEAQSLKSKSLETVFDTVQNWEPIGSVAKIQSGYAFKGDTFKQAGVQLLRNANILPGKVYWDDAVYLSEEDAKRFPTYELAAGDVLISLDRPIISSGIKVARVSDSDLPALLVQRVGRFVFDPNRLDAAYLYAFLQTDRFIEEVSGHEQSLGVPHISPAQVEAIKIPLPDLAAQRRLTKNLRQIIESWSAADAALRKQLDDLAVLPQRILAQAFGDIT